MTIHVYFDSFHARENKRFRLSLNKNLVLFIGLISCLQYIQNRRQLPFVNSSSQQSGRLHPQASRVTILSWVESKQVTRSHSFGRQFHRNVLTREVPP